MSVHLCVSHTFLLTCFFLFVCFVVFLFVCLCLIFYCYSLDACLFSKKRRKGVDSYGRQGGGILKGVGEGN